MRIEIQMNDWVNPQDREQVRGIYSDNESDETMPTMSTNMREVSRRASAWTQGDGQPEEAKASVSSMSTMRSTRMDPTTNPVTGPKRNATDIELNRETKVSKSMSPRRLQVGMDCQRRHIKTNGSLLV